MGKPNVVSKKDLINSAKECIVKMGIEKLTLKAVANGANVTQGTVYYHFRSKEQLLLEIVRDVCKSSWESLDKTNQSKQNLITESLKSARSRTTANSFYHQLFLSLIVKSFTNEKIKTELGELLDYENQSIESIFMDRQLKSPIEGVSIKTWAILLNALIDGLAIQALTSNHFSEEDIYNELELILRELFIG
ncbi:TetR/AcrR family transcriptional regulator [Fictibacillus sp. Mic-4]|uniref:TetR/AcrR family transcriptional regulator n=1 Tax=Fictibacillus TaxID=1329200 RepID=UPI00042235EE|nr:TetR/AcrR family transcriptional regulator [Fictibacillus gelatini]